MSAILSHHKRGLKNDHTLNQYSPLILLPAQGWHILAAQLM
jgi:hypothetical protein